MVIRHLYIDFLLLVIISRLFYCMMAQRVKSTQNRALLKPAFSGMIEPSFGLKPFARSEMDGVV